MKEAQQVEIILTDREVEHALSRAARQKFARLFGSSREWRAFMFSYNLVQTWYDGWQCTINFRKRSK